MRFSNKTIAVRFVSAGACFGLLFPALAFLVRTDAEVLYVIICSAPLVLGGYSYLLGRARGRSVERAEAQYLAKLASWQIDLETGDFQASEDLMELFGLPLTAGGLTEAFTNRILPEDREHVRREVARAVEARSSLEVEYRIKYDDGTIRHIRGLGQVRPNPYGSGEVLFGTAQDVTTELETTNEMKTILVTMTQGLVIQTSEGVVRHHNPAALKILGLSADQLLGRTSLDPRWRALREDGSPFPGEEHPSMCALRSGEPVLDVVMGLDWPDGQRRWIKINATPFVTVKGREVMCTFSDITDRQNAALELRHLFQHAMDLVCIAGLDGRFKRVSPSFSAVLGFEAEFLLATPFRDLIHPLDLAVLERAIVDLAAGHSVRNLELRFCTRGGPYRWISWVCEPDVASGLLYATGRDVTDVRRAEARQRDLLAAIDRSALVTFTDVHGTIVDANENFCRVSGYSREELLGKDHRLVNSGRHTPEFMKDLWSKIAAGEIWVGDIENRAKNGTTYHVRSVIAPLRNIDGEIEHYVAIRFDITHEKALQLRLAEAQCLAQVGNWDVHLRTGTFDWTEQTYRMFELEPTVSATLEVLRTRVLNEDFAEFETKLRRARLHGEDYDFTLRLVPGRGGQFKHLRVIGRVTRDKAGHPTKVTGTVQDVTASVTQRLELQKLLDFNQVMISSAKFAIIATDLAGRVTVFNTEAERMLGYDTAEVMGRKTPELLHDPGEFAGATRDFLSRHRESGAAGVHFDTDQLGCGIPDERRWTFVRKDGGRVQVQLSLTALRDGEGRTYGFLGLAKDVSDEVRLLKAVEAERAKAIHSSRLAALGEMSAGIAHEINNPLGIISAATELLPRYKDVPDKFDAKIQAVLRASARIARIVKGLQKFARSHDTHPREAVALVDILDEALMFTETKARRIGVEVKVVCARDIKISCDRVEIEQVVVNLINNGIDAVQRCGERLIELSAEVDASGVVLRVIDSGTGITAEVEYKLFQPFFTTKPVGEGTGLGLSISKGILDQHGATISLDHSVTNTCFVIRFPACQAVIAAS